MEEEEGGVRGGGGRTGRRRRPDENHLQSHKVPTKTQIKIVIYRNIPRKQNISPIFEMCVSLCETECVSWNAAKGRRQAAQFKASEHRSGRREGPLLSSSSPSPPSISRGDEERRRSPSSSSSSSFLGTPLLCWR